MRRDPTSENSYLQEFKMAFFDNVKTEELLLFVRNLQMTLEASVTLASGVKIQYLRTMVRGEVLCKLDTFSVEVRIITTDHLNLIVLVFGTYLFTVDDLPK